MSLGVHQYPVVVRIDTQTASVSAAVCGWIDSGAAWKKQKTVRTYSSGKVETIVYALGGEIIVSTDGGGSCSMPTQTITYSPPLSPGQTPSQWAATAGTVTSSVVTYEEEITAAAIRSAAEAALEWPGDSEGDSSTREWSTMPQWLNAGLTPVAMGLLHEVEEYPGGCDVNSARMRLTREGASMTEIPITAQWSGGGSGSAHLTGEGATSDWVEVDADDEIAEVTFLIAPYD